ncbi:MAG: ABC transporter permease, partial [Peptostreptococcaceae bacterium]
VLGAMDEVSTKLNSIELIQGNLPSEENEIALDDIALEKLGYEQKLNQKVKFKYSDYSKEDLVEKEFTVVGITKGSDIAKSRKTYSGVVSKEYMENTRYMSKEKFNVFFRVENEGALSGDEVKSTIEEIRKDIDLKLSELMINEDYINAMKPETEIVVGGIVIGMIVILSSVLVIYNIFYLSIVTKVQEFGKLRAIGATKKQVRSIVFKEGVLLAVIAIPLGLIVGYVIGEFLISKMMMITGSKSSKWLIILGVAIISFITVMVSLLKPMKVASKVSIVEAVRYNGSDNKGSKTRKGYSEINLNRLAYANLTRNKKRTYITIISLTLSGIIFIVMSTVLNSINARDMAMRHSPSDISISLDNFTYGDEANPNTELNMLQINNPLGDDFVKELEKLNGVSNVVISNDVKAELKGYKGDWKYHTLTNVDERGLEDLELYLEDGKIDLDKLKTGEEIIMTSDYILEDMDIKVGDNITLVLYDGNEKVEKEFKVQAITSAPGTFALHEDAINKILKTNTNYSLGISVDKNNYENIKNYVNSVVSNNDNLSMSLLEDEIETYEMVIFVTKTMAYSLVIIIGLIGFINLVNSMITSIVTRKKELGMLQAIGLTNKQLIKMLNIEASFYIISMLVGTLTVGNIIGYVAVILFRKSGGSYAVYHFPIVQTIIMIVSIIIALALLTHLITKNFNKESLVDRVRYSE